MSVCGLPDKKIVMGNMYLIKTSFKQRYIFLQMEEIFFIIIASRKICQLSGEYDQRKLVKQLSTRIYTLKKLNEPCIDNEFFKITSSSSSFYRDNFRFYPTPTVKMLQSVVTYFQLILH